MTLKETKSATVKVTSDNCASSMGSGSLNVFATPAMVALMEQAACKVINPSLSEKETSVGTKLDIVHIKASPIGETIEATATLTSIDGRKLTFEVIAKDSKGIIGKGIHERVIVTTEKFLSKLL